MTSEPGFCHVWVTLDNVDFFESFDKGDSIRPWTIMIPLEGGGHIELAPVRETCKRDELGSANRLIAELSQASHEAESRNEDLSGR